MDFGFEQRHFDNRVITGAPRCISLECQSGTSADHYEMMGVDVAFKTTYNWVSDLLQDDHNLPERDRPSRWQLVPSR